MGRRKQAVRERIWDALEVGGVARFPYPPHGRIPNFVDAAIAAERLAQTEEWGQASAIKCNPDAPQLPVRRRALADGKTLYMAVPRLRDLRCFRRLEPETIDDIDHATTVSGSTEVGISTHPSDVEPIDLIVAGSVAVTPAGDRIGKGEGYSDLEYGILKEFDVASESTTTATTVHEWQLIESVESSSTDVPIELVVTPDQTIHTDPSGPYPAGIDRDRLTQEQLSSIPILEQLCDEQE